MSNSKHDVLNAMVSSLTLDLIADAPKDLKQN
jgi:hypothetical protein